MLMLFAVKSNKKILVVLLTLTLLLSACWGKEEDALDEDAVNQVYTSVAETLAARPTVTLMPTLAAPTATATLLPTLPSAPPSAPVVATITSPVPTAVPCHEALYMSDVTVPDGTVFAPGAVFTKTWRIFNAGSCDWEANYALSFSSGDEMSGVPVALGTIIPPNGQSDISVTLTAPLTAGSYTSYWQLTAADGTKFGNAIFVAITVGENTPTPTQTVLAPTETPTLAPTP